VAPAVVDAAVARRAQYLAELNDTADADGWSIYELTSTVSQVWDRDKAAARPCHLITHVRRADGWYLFNDFHVLPVPQRHALRFNHWKWPCVLQFDCLLPATDALFVAAEPRRATITGDVFFERSPYHQHNASVPRTFVPVTRRTMPGAGDVVALDAEFVSLGAEETEIREDGSRAIINPVHFALARVSLCRENGECFMDDYVATHEPVVDYLTRYSGIAPGDLEPNTSKKHLATHKHVYLKLRYLIDRGVVLLGHGLAKDFRIINIAPPADRVIDTVELFHLERQRKIALRFLASVLLGSDIQTHSHDSVEDALSALKLWKTCRALRDAGDGVFARTLNKVYQIGRTTEWKVENLDSSAQEILWSEIQLIKK
jgi:PAB-dependent poly(A)-specific ribonuclease subunit 2